MVAKYYASNRQGEVPFGWVLKEIEQSDDKITLLDETENQVLTVSKQGLVEISKEDYEKINLPVFIMWNRFKYDYPFKDGKSVRLEQDL